MNMPLATANPRQSDSFSTAKIMPFTRRNTGLGIDLERNEQLSNELLDKHFALQNGSHNDVKQYVIYFHHIMAFFADGSHCGLQKNSQFVAFSGHKESPDSIVFKQNNTHIELILSKQCACANENTQLKATTLLKVPTQEMFTSVFDEDYFVE